MRNADRWMAAVLLATVSTAALARDAARDKSEVLQAEATLCQAFQSGDADVLRDGLARDFTLVDSHGTVSDYAQNIDEVTRREPYYDEFRNHDQQVRVHGHAAIVIGITSIKGKAGGKAFAADFRYTDTWLLHGGRWRLAASHASRLP